VLYHVSFIPAYIALKYIRYTPGLIIAEILTIIVFGAELYTSVADYRDLRIYNKELATDGETSLKLLE